MWKEFKAFAMRGNVIDLAVGIIIGGAFGKIVSSLVSDILMPPVGVIIGNVDFSDLALTLKAAADGKPAVTLSYGLFFNQVINFLIVAGAVFLLVRTINRLKSQPPPPEPTQKSCPECLQAIPIKARRCSFCTSVITAS